MAEKQAYKLMNEDGNVFEVFIKNRLYLQYGKIRVKGFHTKEGGADLPGRVSPGKLGMSPTEARKTSQDMNSRDMKADSLNMTRVEPSSAFSATLIPTG